MGHRRAPLVPATHSPMRRLSKKDVHLARTGVYSASQEASGVRAGRLCSQAHGRDLSVRAASRRTRWEVAADQEHPVGDAPWVGESGV